MEAQFSSIPETTILNQLRAQLTGIFSVSVVDVPQPPDRAIRFRGYLQQEPEQAFVELSRRFESLNYTPSLARDEKNGGQDVLVAMRGVARPRPARAWINLLLFIVTVFTTLLAGSATEEGDLFSGVPFAFTLLAILGTHEFGHYFVARYHGAAVTLPYFIPMPPLGAFSLGTMGAVIQLRSPIRNRRQLFDIGVAGPLAGLAVAIPLLIYGLSQSSVELLPTDGVYLLEGNSLLYMGLKFLVHGKILPRHGLDVSINSMAFAAWIGLFVTCLNLLPIGQLDGGHVAYALFGRRAWQLARITVGALFVLGLVGGWEGWFLWVLLPFVFGLRHPPPLNDHTPLDSRRKALGVMMILVFILVFTPVPFSIIYP